MIAYAYRLDPRDVLAIADEDPSLYATMESVAEELAS